VTGASVLQRARESGVLLEARGSLLHFRAPRKALTQGVRAALTILKRDIVAILKAPGQHDPCAFFCGNPLYDRYCRKCGGTWDDYIACLTGLAGAGGSCLQPKG